MIEEHFNGCSDGHTNEQTYSYTIKNLSYNPVPGTTNGVSGFQVVFAATLDVGERHNELVNGMLPAAAGWDLDTFSGIGPTMGIQFDRPNPMGLGVMPGFTGVFSFCVGQRADVVVSGTGVGFGPAGWVHSWDSSSGTSIQVFIFHSDQSVPGDKIVKAVPEFGAPLSLITSLATLALIVGVKKKFFRLANN